jgi:soluble lytic murein transglycosylase-like protein
MDAAARYLKKLNQTFKDSRLALSAYNWGPGNMSKLIKSSGESTWRDLENKIPNKEYVHKIETQMKNIKSGK